MNKQQEGQKRQKNIGYGMLAIVIALYTLAALSDTTSAYKALQNSWDILVFILPILLIVLLVMAAINTYIQPKKLLKYLGKDSGIKGWVIVILAGVISHGPGYVWYPMLSDLRSHGMKNGLIVAFFYARSIKIPWIPMMISYFSLSFTVILTCYILLGALIQGLVAEKFIGEDKKP